jgi:ketosteroid isomerase-like protein
MMTNDNDHSAIDEQIIRRQIDGYVSAIRRKDVEKVMQIFAPNLVSFDLEAPLQHMGAQSKRGNWTKAFDAYRSLDYDIRELTLTMSANLALGRSVNWISGTMADGKKNSYWVRWTTCFQKIDGEWLIIHDHVSVPLDIKNGKGVLDIEP